MDRAARTLALAAAAIVAVALVATCAWVVLTLGVRPLDGVEGDLLFEADRLRAGLALYTDPAAGAYDYGAVPARYLVLYPPVWSSALSLVPRDAAAAVARAASALAWFGLLGLIAWRAPRARRLATATGAAFVAGVWVLALYGASGRPDAVAVLASGLALERAARRAAERDAPEIGALCGALFALAAWIKPNVVGAAPGAFVAAVLLSRARGRSTSAAIRGVAGGLVGALGVTAALAAILTGASGGAWVGHLLASTGQPPSLSLWLGQMGSRLPFLGAPLAAALVIGVRSRRDPGAAIATGALVSSVLWCALCLAKIGSAANYFLEPCVCAVVVLARADLPALAPRGRAALALGAVVQAAWTGVASVRSSLEHVPLARAKAAALASARATCGAPPGALVVADEPGLELALDGRVVQTPFQSTHLARRGRFPVRAWIADLDRPEVRCLVMQDDLLERPLAEVAVEHDRFGPELRRALVARFELAGERAGYRIYRRRPGR